jgi:TonB family protein
MRATSPISAAPADPYVRRLAVVCDMHQVAVGSPAELAKFLVALDEDKHLAMDFWAVMRKMSEEGSAYLAGQPLNERMLEVVVEAVTGQSLAEVITSSEESLEVVERLSRLLGGEDLSSPVVVDIPPKIEEPDVEAKKPMGRAETPSRLSRSRADEPDRSPVEIRPSQRAAETPAGPRPFAAKPPIAELRAGAPITAEEQRALERLQLLHWALQNFPANSSARADAELLSAKLNAAEVLAKYSATQPKYAPQQSWGAEREAAMQTPIVELPVEPPVAKAPAEMKAPAVEQAVPMNSPQNGVILGPEQARVPEPVQVGRHEDSWRLMDGRDLVIHPTQATSGRDPHELRRPLSIPLSGYDDEPEMDQQVRIFKLVLAGVVGVGMLIGLLLAHLHTVKIWQSLAASLQEMRGTFSPHVPPALDVPNELVVDPPPPDPEPPQPVRRAVRPSVRLPVPAPSFQPRQAMTKNLRTDQPVARIYPSFSVRNDPAVRNDVRSDPAVRSEPPSTPATASAAGGTSSEVAPSPGGIGPLPVPASVMETNLMISRLPTYPDAARATHTEGRVMLQAVVNRDGTVGHLRVISGDPALRGAALDAAAKWRYRPYTVNGQPVDVSTTVAVDFRLDQ